MSHIIQGQKDLFKTVIVYYDFQFFILCIEIREHIVLGGFLIGKFSIILRELL